MIGEGLAFERVGMQRIIAKNGGPVLRGHPHPREIARLVFPGSPFEKGVEPGGPAKKSHAIMCVMSKREVPTVSSRKSGNAEGARRLTPVLPNGGHRLSPIFLTCHRRYGTQISETGKSPTFLPRRPARPAVLLCH